VLASVRIACPKPSATERNSIRTRPIEGEKERGETGQLVILTGKPHTWERAKSQEMRTSLEVDVPSGLAGSGWSSIVRIARIEIYKVLYMYICGERESGNQINETKTLFEA
jgi:hypothetical protein